MLAHSFLYRIFKLPWVLNLIFNIGGLINSIIFCRNAHFDVILKSNYIFFANRFVTSHLLAKKDRKHQNILSLAHHIALGVETSSLTSTPQHDNANRSVKNMKINGKYIVI